MNFLFAVYRPFQSPQQFLIAALLAILQGYLTGLALHLIGTRFVWSVALFFVIGIIGLLLTGYTLLCAASSMKNRTALPLWIQIPYILTIGAKALLIGVIYSIPFVILTIVTFGSSIVSAPNLDLFGPVGIIAGLAFLLTAYMIPVAFMHFLTHGLQSAFDISTIIKKAFTVPFFSAFLFVTAYTLVCTALASLLPLPEFVMISISAIVSIAIRITAMTVYGSAYVQ